MILFYSWINQNLWYYTARVFLYLKFLYKLCIILLYYSIATSYYITKYLRALYHNNHALIFHILFLSHSIFCLCNFLSYSESTKLYFSWAWKWCFHSHLFLFGSVISFPKNDSTLDFLFFFFFYFFFCNFDEVFGNWSLHNLCIAPLEYICWKNFIKVFQELFLIIDSLNFFLTLWNLNKTNIVQLKTVILFYSRINENCWYIEHAVFLLF